MRQFNLLALLLAISPIVAACQESGASVAMVKMPYTGARNVPEKSGGPDYLEDGGITTIVQDMGVTLQPISTIALNEDDERQYGEWHRMGLANGHLADLVAQNVREGKLHVGLLGNCTSVIGTLGGLQKSGPDDAPLRVGLVFIDAHGDFNTPETTLSEMLGGMPVAVSAGLGLRNLRLWSGLDPAIPTDHIVMGAVRDLDPLERELVEEHDIRMITVDDIRTLSDNLHQQMERLSSETDVIYVHIDKDVLDPREVPGHPLTVANGPTSMELAAAIAEMFKYEKVRAFGVASTPYGERDPDGVSRQAAYNLVQGAIRGAQERGAL